MELVYYFTALTLGLVIGLLTGRFLLTQLVAKLEVQARERAAQIISEAEAAAENVKERKHLEAKARFQELKQKHEAEVSERKRELAQTEQRIQDQQKAAKTQAAEVQRDRERVSREREQVEALQQALLRKQEEVEKLRQQQVAQLETVTGLSASEARAQLVANLREEASAQALAQAKQSIDEAKATANREAKRIVLQSIQRTAAEHSIENTVSIFHLENDEVKGRIIGREGRNIRTLEAATGAEIIVDDTPEAIIISGFDPVRREVARLALHRLVTDGRIHPARIEEVVGKVQKALEDEIREVGERTCIDLNIHGLHPELVRMVGRMKYRSSYGQNLLQHSREVANLCAIMAAELGLNPKLARRAGLLHDIGKVSEDNPEQPHALLGMELAQKYKEHPEIVNAIGAHHDEIEMTSLISPIVQACDAISGARPGARREMVESYIQRLKDLEALALGYPGVSKSFALQAGRELRVIVEAERVSDDQADAMAYDISTRIQNEMQYPGQIKVTVIREKRAVAFAK